MPSKNDNQKIDHDLGIPLSDDYFFDEPEAIEQDKKMPEPASTIQGITQIVTRKK